MAISNIIISAIVGILMAYFYVPLLLELCIIIVLHIVIGAIIGAIMGFAVCKLVQALIVESRKPKYVFSLCEMLAILSILINVSISFGFGLAKLI